MAESKIVRLRSRDGEIFELSERTARRSETIRQMLEELEDVDRVEAIPVPNVTSVVLSKVIEYCKKHDLSDEDEQDKDALEKFDKNFVNVDQPMLFDLILAANYLNIKDLLDLTCKTVADMIRGKTVQQIRTHFHINNDYTPEELEEVRRENQWAFE